MTFNGPFVDHIWRATRRPFYPGWPCWEQLPTGQWQRSYRSNHNHLPISLLIKGLDRTLKKRGYPPPHPQLFLSVDLRNWLPLHAEFCQSYPDEVLKNLPVTERDYCKLKIKVEHGGKLVKSVAQFFSVNKWPSITGIFLTRILPFLSMFTRCIKSFVQLAIELLVLYHLNCSVFTLLFQNEINRVINSSNRSLWLHN